MIRAELVDSVIAVLHDGDDAASRPLAALLDEEDGWDWHSDDGREDRAAVIESSGAWWCVSVISGVDRATRHAYSADADARFASLVRGAQ